MIASAARRAYGDLRISARTRRDWFAYAFQVAMFAFFANMFSGHADRLAELAGGVAAQAITICWAVLPQHLNGDRTDGSLLRMRLVPDGVRVYVVARLMYAAFLTLVTTVAMIVVAVAFYHIQVTAQSAVAVVWSVGLGFAAVAPWGMALSTVLPTSREAASIAMLPVAGLLIISGVFIPTSVLPGWLSDIGRVLPASWFVGAIRGALLPGQPHPAAWAAALVMAAWAVAGFVVTIPAVRRVASRESGSRLAARRERATAKGVMR